MKIQDTKTVKSYFRGSPRYGRTTTLIEKKTGRILCEVMGISTRKGTWDCYNRLKSKGEAT